MALTPVDIQHTEFKTALKGYNKNQVDEFVRSVTQALDEALKNKAESQRKIDSLQEELDRIRKIESAITDALILAQKSAEEVKANAHKSAELILQEAEQFRVKLTAEAQQETAKYRTEITLLEATRDRFEIEFRSMLSGYTEWLNRRKSDDDVRTEVA